MAPTSKDTASVVIWGQPPSPLERVQDRPALYKFSLVYSVSIQNIIACGPSYAKNSACSLCVELWRSCAAGLLRLGQDYSRKLGFSLPS